MGMTTIISKSAALAAISANRENHIKLVTEAREGFKKQATELLKKMLAKVTEDRIGEEALRLHMTPPADYTRLYDGAIAQLTVHQGETLSIDSETYNQLIGDDWEWTPTFVHTNREYSSSTVNWARGKGL